MKIKQKYKSLLCLAIEQIKEVNSMLLAGESALIVATKIKKDWGLLPDISEEALRKQVSRYREELMSHTPLNEQPKESVKVNCIKELLQLVPMQKKRLLKLYAKEEELPVLDREVTAEMAHYTKMLMELAKLETPNFLHSGATLAQISAGVDNMHKE